MEYEISKDNKVLGNVKIYKKIDNYNKSLIISEDNIPYRINNHSKQTYLVDVSIDSIDDLYDIINLYKKDKIFDEIEYLKKFNNINKIKKNTVISIIIPYNSLKRFKKTINDIDIFSLLKSKVSFIQSVYSTNRNIDIKDKLNNVIRKFNKFKSSQEYEFMTDEEKEAEVKKYINQANELIDYIENLTEYRFGEDFITPIKLK